MSHLFVPASRFAIAGLVSGMPTQAALTACLVADRSGGEDPSRDHGNTRARSRSGRDHRSDRPTPGTPQRAHRKRRRAEIPSLCANPLRECLDAEIGFDKVQGGDAGDLLSDSQRLDAWSKESSRCLFPCGLAHPARKSHCRCRAVCSACCQLPTA